MAPSTLEKNTDSVSAPPGPAGKGARRRQRYELRDGLRYYSTLPRVAKCGRCRVSADVGIRSGPGGCHFTGIATCGSVWCCPVCAAKIAARRTEEAHAALTAHMGAGGGAAFLTLTLPHNAGDELAPMRRVVGDALRAVKSGRAWLSLSARLGVVGTIRAVETTHGAHGWHPHVHVLVLTAHPLGADDLEELRAHAYERWRRRVVRAGHDAPYPELCPIQTVWDADIAGYVSKLGAALELTQGHAKQGREGRRTPFGILADFLAYGDADDLALWRVWESGMKGARQLEWSRGLKQRFRIGERTDEQLAAEDVGGEDVTTIPALVWDVVARRLGATARLLELAEGGGADAVWRWLYSLPIWPPGAPARC